jgi:hypothetical protein
MSSAVVRIRLLVTIGIERVFYSPRRTISVSPIGAARDRLYLAPWIASTARRRACRASGSMRSSSSLSRFRAGFAGRPELPGGRDSNSSLDDIRLRAYNLTY